MASNLPPLNMHGLGLTPIPEDQEMNQPGGILSPREPAEILSPRVKVISGLGKTALLTFQTDEEKNAANKKIANDIILLTGELEKLATEGTDKAVDKKTKIESKRESFGKLRTRSRSTLFKTQSIAQMFPSSELPSSSASPSPREMISPRSLSPEKTTKTSPSSERKLAHTSEKKSLSKVSSSGTASHSIADRLQLIAGYRNSLGVEIVKNKKGFEDKYEELVSLYAQKYCLSKKHPSLNDLQDQTLYDDVLKKMIKLCMTEGFGHVELLDSGTSKVYLLGCKPVEGGDAVPLFIAKPLSGELGASEGKREGDGSLPEVEDAERYEPGMAGVREYLVFSSGIIERPSILTEVTFPEKEPQLSFVTAFVKSKGSLEDILGPIDSKGEKPEEKIRREKYQAIAIEVGIDQKSKKMSTQEIFWKNVLDIKSVQICAIIDMLYGNSDSNVGNVLIDFTPPPKGLRAQDIILIPIDYGKALPSSWPVYEKEDFWLGSNQVNKELDKSLIEKIENFDVEKEVAHMQETLKLHGKELPPLVFDIFRAHAYSLKVGVSILQELKPEKKIISSLETIRRFQTKTLPSSELNSNQGPNTPLHAYYLDVLGDGEKMDWKLFTEGLEARLAAFQIKLDSKSPPPQTRQRAFSKLMIKKPSDDN